MVLAHSVVLLRRLCHQFKSPSELLNNRKLQPTLTSLQRTLITSIDRNLAKESFHEPKKQQGWYYKHSAEPALPLLHDGQRLRLYDSRSKTWQPGKVQGQACAFRSHRVKLTTTRSVYHRTRSQLKPDKAFSDHTNTQGSPVNHPTPNH